MKHAIRNQNDLKNKDTELTKLSTPDDGSCMFWAVVNSTLIPHLENEETFRREYINLFGEAAAEHIDHIKSLLLAVTIEYAQTNGGSGTAINALVNDDRYKALVNHLRNRAVDFMVENRDEYEGFMEDGRNFDDYAANMRNPKTWGGEQELNALSRLLQRNVVTNRDNQAPRPSIDENQLPRINIHYNGINHYEAIVGTEILSNYLEDKPLINISIPSDESKNQPDIQETNPKVKDLITLNKVIQIINEINDGREILAKDLEAYLLQISILVGSIYRRDTDKNSIRNIYGVFNFSSKKPNATGIDFDAIGRLSFFLNEKLISPEDLEKEKANLLNHLLNLRYQFKEIIEKETPKVKASTAELEKETAKSNLPKIVEKPQDSQINAVCSISNFHNVKYCARYVEAISKDAAMMDAVVNFRNDSNGRYSFARFMTIVGEMSKQMPQYQGDGMEEFFSVFTKIKDIRNNLAHKHGRYIANPSQDIFDGMATINLTELFQKIATLLVAIDQKLISYNQNQINLSEQEKTLLSQIGSEVDILERIFPDDDHKPIDLLFRDIDQLVKVATEYEKAGKNKKSKEPKLIRAIAQYNLSAQGFSEFTAIEGIPSLKQLKEIRNNVDAKRIAEQKAIQENSGSNKPKTDLEKEAEKQQKLLKAITKIRKEMNFLNEALKNDSSSYVIEWAIIAIGELCGQINQNYPQFMDEIARQEFGVSIKKNYSVRNKLAHDITSKKYISLEAVIYRETFPMLADFEAAIILLENTQGSSDYLMGKAYLALGQYEKAHQYWNKILQDNEPQFEIQSTEEGLTIIDHDTDEKLTNYLNALFMQSATYYKQAESAARSGLRNEEKKFHNQRIENLQDILRILEEEGEDLQNPSSDLTIQIAAAYINLGVSFNAIESYDKAIKYHKLAYQILKKQNQIDPPERESIYLLNIAVGYLTKICSTDFFKKNNQLAQADYGQLLLAKSCLWEAKRIWDESGKPKENADYLNILVHLIRSSIMDGMSNPVNIFYAKELREEAEAILKKTALRNSTATLRAVENLKNVVEHPEFIALLNDQSAKQDFTNNRELLNIEFRINMLTNLSMLYVDFGISTDALGAEIEQLNSQRKQFPIQISSSRKAEFDSKFSFRNNLATEHFRNGRYREALPDYLDAYKVLMDEFADFKPQVLGHILFSLGDTYEQLGNNKLAFKRISESLNADLEYEPNEETFSRFERVFNLNKKLYPDDFAERNLQMAKDYLEKFQQKIGPNDSRLNNIRIMILSSLLDLERYQEALAVHQSFIFDSKYPKPEEYDELRKWLKDISQGAVREYTIRPDDNSEQEVHNKREALQSLQNQVPFLRVRELRFGPNAQIIGWTTYLPSDLLKKDIREKLSLERKVVPRNLIEDKRKKLEKEIPDIVIEEYKEDSSKLLITFPKQYLDRIKKILDGKILQQPAKAIEERQPDNRLETTPFSSPTVQNSVTNLETGKEVRHEKKQSFAEMMNKIKFGDDAAWINRG